ncbi:Pimeloyl-ACP methyl ester carboxylesterase [Methylobacterium sp. 174MFSha1.1]|uniref:alpha/beta fold hydrolase n=1 Tax=Methylobacterium sp. 174MFSha1.1 TaxID=1502749 RepID=UPI0008E74CBC|nr:alpha/beta hydrolase [Methylobacterium sp. 174MFSha1.1]SFU76700.1 Pimeloyl-ACP methyl ester carboxylesterase [Methylobacterium sp. 174MFSha1.1]
MTGLPESLHLAIRVEGHDGPCVLWIHGYTIDSSLWRGLWDALPGCRHLAVDLPGHGASPPLRAEETLATLGRRLARWAVAEGVRHVVGLSLGSTVALQVAIEAPDAFETLTLGAPAFGGGPVEGEVGRRYAELRHLHRDLGHGPWLADRWMVSPPDLFTAAKGKPLLWPDIARVVRRHRWEELPDFAIARIATWPQPLASIRRIRARGRIFIGSSEMPAFVETAFILESALEQAEIVRLDDAGHLCMIETPLAAAETLRLDWGLCS